MKQRFPLIINRKQRSGKNFLAAVFCSALLLLLRHRLKNLSGKIARSVCRAFLFKPILSAELKMFCFSPVAR